MRDLFLHQSRRCHRLLNNLFGISSRWTNYYAWEYNLPNGINFELLYTPTSDMPRFNIFRYGVKRDGSYGVVYLLRTDSFKECVHYMRMVLKLNPVLS